MDIEGEIRELKRVLVNDDMEESGTSERSLSIFEVDRDGNFLKVPANLEKISGFSMDELNLLSLQNVILVEDRPRIQEALDQVFSGAEIEIVDVEVFSEKAGAHPVEIIILPMRKESGIAGAWGVVRDIGQSKDLEHRLEAARKMSRASMEFLRDFVSLMSREIRQPLTTILLTLEMMDSGFYGDITDQQKEKISQLISLTDKLKSLLNEATSATRNISEEIELDRSMVSIGKVIMDVLKEKRSDLGRKNITVTTNFPEENVCVTADRKSIVQVISTLLDRSVEASPKGGHILVELERRKNVLQFSVADSGEGLSEEEVEGLFDRIHIVQDRESGSLKEGLNLYMAKRIIEKHGGRIWCESFPGLGSSLLFTLPIKKEEGSDG